MRRAVSPRTTTLDIELEGPPKDPGFIKFYGLYWSKQNVDWKSKHLLGRPKGWMGQGKTSDKHSDLQMNFWKQKGVYILYDNNLHPVYAGQAGISSNSIDGIGNRLLNHHRGIYRNGWFLFSWFGFLETDAITLRNESEHNRLNPEFSFSQQQASIGLKHLLASFEAILIEGFAPRFNSRGGDLGKAVLVDQHEKLQG